MGENKFDRKQDLITSRYVSACSLIDGNTVLVTGGIGMENATERLNSSEVLNLFTWKWETGPTMPVVTFQGKMLTAKGVTFLIGGYNAQSDIYKLEKLDSSPSTWRFTKVG